MMQGQMKYQHAFHHSQKKKLLFPIIISMSSIKRLPPVMHEKNMYMYTANVSLLVLIQNQSSTLHVEPQHFHFPREESNHR